MLKELTSALCLTVFGAAAFLSPSPSFAAWDQPSKSYSKTTVIYVTSNHNGHRVNKHRHARRDRRDVRRVYIKRSDNWKAYRHDYWRRTPTTYYADPPAPTQYAGNKTIGGGIIGAALGALTGSKFGKGSGRTVSILGGAVLGAVIGGNIGKSMDQQDEAKLSDTLEYYKTGQQAQWRNTETGAEYAVTPVRTYQAPDGTFCRDYTTWGWIDGYEEKLHGTACRLPDGTWENR